ncbi:uncharacterized protein LOC120695892 [Panicum virgatum]|uniref:uncharacterized protein LOC120695892 n=1 Tax=Panicum virgatum TaxID=38727 RepID=UPI0019D518CF|nr:uncharacterized protein LOC120695892 [Panicum virgatum]
MFGGSSSGKGLGRASGKGARKGPHIVWDGPIGPNFFGEAVYEFLVECKSEFSNNIPLRGYNNRKEEWPKCSHGEDCIVQMMTEGMDEGRHFFRCPRAWSSEAPEGYKFARWVDPPPFHPHVEYIYYLQNCIFDLEREVSAGNVEDDINTDDTNSQEVLCTDSYCKCPYHKNKGPTPPPPPPPPPPPSMGGYYGEGATQFSMWGHY